MTNNVITAKKKTKNKNKSVFAIILFIVLALYALTFIITIGVGLLNSVKGPLELVNELPNPDYNTVMIPEFNIFYNYAYFFENFWLKINSYSFYSVSGTLHNRVAGTDGYVTILNLLLNTGIYAIICPAITTIVSSVSGYLCSKYKYWYSNMLYVLLLITMAIPLVGTQTSTITMLKQMGIYDTYFSMFLMTANFGGLYFFIFFAHFQGISNTYIEAAELDGASQFGVLVRIILPLAYKTMLTVYVIQLVALWNNYENIRLYYPTKPTLAYGVWELVTKDAGSSGVDKQIRDSLGFQLAGCMVLSVPTLVLFACLKNVLMGNLTMGGLKE